MGLVLRIYKKVQTPVLEVLKHFPAVRRRLRERYYATRRRNYTKLADEIAVDEKTVLFESYGGKQFACSPRAIYEYMLQKSEYSAHQFYWSFQDDCIEEFYEDPLLERAHLIVRGSEEYLKLCAKAKYWIFNNRIAEYIQPKEEQVYLQCWHGTPLKRLGADVSKDTRAALNTAEELAWRFRIDSKKWNFLISPSEYATQHLCDAFSVPAEERASVVLEEGYPRNDILVEALKEEGFRQAVTEELCKELGVSSNKKMLLYAPTWRDDEHSDGEYVMQHEPLDFQRLEGEFGDDWIILFRAHYYISNSFDFAKYKGFVVDVSKEIDINRLYIAADALLTDYSSVFFDFANTSKPILFFWPDYEHYKNDVRGFYFDPETLPGPHCITTDELINELAAFDLYEKRFGEELRYFREVYCPYDDGYASERVVRRVFPFYGG